MVIIYILFNISATQCSTIICFLAHFYIYLINNTQSIYPETFFTKIVFFPRQIYSFEAKIRFYSTIRMMF
jgi:hypothetical protein